MADLNYELVWVKDLLSEFGFTLQSSMRLYCINQAVIHVTENPIFHMCTKHNEVDRHVVHQKVVKSCSVK